MGPGSIVPLAALGTPTRLAWTIDVGRQFDKVAIQRSWQNSQLTGSAPSSQSFQHIHQTNWLTHLGFSPTHEHLRELITRSELDCSVRSDLFPRQLRVRIHRRFRDWSPLTYFRSMLGQGSSLELWNECANVGGHPAVFWQPRTPPHDRSPQFSAGLCRGPVRRPCDRPCR